MAFGKKFLFNLHNADLNKKKIIKKLRQNNIIFLQIYIYLYIYIYNDEFVKIEPVICRNFLFLFARLDLISVNKV